MSRGTSRSALGVGLLVLAAMAPGCHSNHDPFLVTDTLSSTTASNDANDLTRVTDGSSFQIAVFVQNNGQPDSNATINFTATASTTLSEVGNASNSGSTISVSTNGNGQ